MAERKSRAQLDIPVDFVVYLPVLDDAQTRLAESVTHPPKLPVLVSYTADSWN